MGGGGFIQLIRPKESPEPTVVLKASFMNVIPRADVKCILTHFPRIGVGNYSFPRCTRVTVSRCLLFVSVPAVKDHDDAAGSEE